MSADGNKKWTKNLDNFESVAYFGDDNEECDEENEEDDIALSQPVPHARVRAVNPSRSFSQPDYIYYPETIPRRNDENGEVVLERRKKKRKRNIDADVVDKGLERDSKRAKTSRPKKSATQKKKL